MKPALPYNALIAKKDGGLDALLREILYFQGCNCFFPRDREEALSLVESANIDLVICDTGESGIEGRKLFEAARENGFGASFVFLQSPRYADKVEADYFLKEGASAYGIPIGLRGLSHMLSDVINVKSLNARPGVLVYSDRFDGTAPHPIDDYIRGVLSDRRLFFAHHLFGSFELLRQNWIDTFLVKGEKASNSRLAGLVNAYFPHVRVVREGEGFSGSPQGSRKSSSGQRGTLTVLMGHQCAGKSEVATAASMMDPNIYVFPTDCSGPPRLNEVNGKDHWFKAVINQKAPEYLVTWQQRNREGIGGVNRLELEQTLSQGKDVIVVLPPEVVPRIKEFYPETKFYEMISAPNEIHRRVGDRCPWAPKDYFRVREGCDSFLASKGNFFPDAIIMNHDVYNRDKPYHLVVVASDLVHMIASRKDS